MPKKTKGCKKGASPVDETPAEKFVRASLNSNKVVVFVGSEDPFSMRALSALRRSGVKTKFMNSVMISGIQGEDDIRDYFLEITDGRSLPRVFVNGKFVGGASDLEYLEISGELQQLLKQAKAYKPVKPF
ncbi:hypothetical protein ACHWQZ_G001925 [Mnemiopsis leidyi]